MKWRDATRRLLTQAKALSDRGQIAWAIDHLEAAWHLSTGSNYQEDPVVSMEVGNSMLLLLKKVRPQ